MTVAAEVDKDLRIHLKRLTRGGGSESLAGIVDESGKVSLRGRGANSPDDAWSAEYGGDMKGNTLSASGTITAVGAPETRSCRLALQHGAGDAAKTGQTGR